MKKVEFMIDLASQALYRVATGIDALHPGKSTRRDVLIALTAKRAKDVWNENYTTDLDTQAIPPPDESFINGHWGRITVICADKYHCYLVWGGNFRNDGLRVGTLEEYERNQYSLKGIAEGVAKAVGRRTRVIRRHGGESFELGVVQKQLEAGEPQEK